MSFVMRMARSAASVVTSSNTVVNPYGNMKGGWYEERLLSYVDMAKIHQAINENNFDLAMENFQGVKKWLNDMYKEQNVNFAELGSPTNQKSFEFFVQKINEQGLKYWFPQEPLEHWADLVIRDGWERFIMNTVSYKMKREADDAVSKAKAA
jgi:hypothetical protein